MSVAFSVLLPDFNVLPASAANLLSELNKNCLCGAVLFFPPGFLIFSNRTFLTVRFGGFFCFDAWETLKDIYLCFANVRVLLCCFVLYCCACICIVCVTRVPRAPLTWKHGQQPFRRGDQGCWNGLSGPSILLPEAWETSGKMTKAAASNTGPAGRSGLLDGLKKKSWESIITSSGL